MSDESVNTLFDGSRQTYSSAPEPIVESPPESTSEPTGNADGLSVLLDLMRKQYPASFKYGHDSIKAAFARMVESVGATTEELVSAFDAHVLDDTRTGSGSLAGEFPPKPVNIKHHITEARKKARFNPKPIDTPSEAERAQARVHSHPAVREQLKLSGEVRRAIQQKYRLDYKQGAHNRFLMRVLELCMHDSQNRGLVGIESVEQALTIAHNEMERLRNAKAASEVN